MYYLKHHSKCTMASQEDNIAQCEVDIRLKTTPTWNISHNTRVYKQWFIVTEHYVHTVGMCLFLHILYFLQGFSMRVTCLVALWSFWRNAWPREAWKQNEILSLNPCLRPRLEHPTTPYFHLFTSPPPTHTPTCNCLPLCMYRVRMHVMLYARLSTVVFSHGWFAESMIESRYQCDQISHVTNMTVITVT